MIFNLTQAVGKYLPQLVTSTNRGHWFPEITQLAQFVVPQRKMKLDLVERALLQLRLVLQATRNSVKKTKVLNPVGMVPFSELQVKCISWRYVMFPTHIGIWPTKVLLSA